jgi:class 3 adenylate cyclase
MQCARCRYDNTAGAKFCGECGTRLEAGCAACGTLNPPGNKFCHECGSALGGAANADSRFASPDAYTPSHLARKILTARASLPGERKKVPILFADLKGSLELMADRDPEDARALLDDVIERLMEGVHRFEGTVNLDRRHGESRPEGSAAVERRAADGRRLAIDQALRTRGLAVVLPLR